MRRIVGHPRGRVAEVFRASERPTFDEVFRHIRVKNL
jgi:hypothetical protein